MITLEINEHCSAELVENTQLSVGFPGTWGQ